MPWKSAPAAVCLLAGVFAMSAPATAQDGSAETPVVSAARAGATPRIDGRLDDGVWESAPVVTAFRQKEPLEGEAATETTHVRIVYDDAMLYIGVELLDSDPSQIRATELRRDNTLETDDTFSILLDTFLDHRNGFLFRVNARGTRFDALVRNESRFLATDWDEQWTAAAQITERGWTAEFAIPFKILRFSAAKEQVWGVNFERVIKRKNELSYWAAWDRDFGFYHVSQAGRLNGIRDIKPGERVRIRPYVVAGAERLAAVAQPGPTRALREVGIDDLKFAVASNLTADLAVNPDFAQTEVDAQRVNLTRFSLFFPEKRQFFIEGGESLKMGVGLLHFGPPPLELFYSRNVGLSAAGTPIPVIAGGKLTGKVRGFDVGVLNVQTDGVTGQNGENFAVARVRKEVFERSYIGAIATNRGGDFANNVAGVDGRFVIKKYFNLMGVLARSDDERSATPQWARQIGAEWRDDRIEAGVNYIGIDPEFNPGVGFVRRRDRMTGTRVSWKPRPGGRIVRQFEVVPSLVYYHDDRRTLLTRQGRLGAAAVLQSGERIDVSIENDFDRLPGRFTIAPGVTLPAGAYEWNLATASFATYNGRRASLGVSLGAGDFYNGTTTIWTLVGDIRVNKNVSLNATYNINDVDLLQGAFVTHLVGLKANISFSTNLLTSTYLQYNNAGQLAATQVRVNYIFRTIDNIYLVFNENRFTEGPFEGRSNRSLVMKATYSVHR
jgi:hypothetical protein